ncbi:MAG: T9SS type A sorting domain-containing protein [Candidatus Kapabacteria bacterium]|nr:T9SS type A sorting domain-containing protein [Candidatus Kapabacteria bacterium]
MFNSIVLFKSNIIDGKKTFLTSLIISFIFSTTVMLSQQYGGFTDPQRPSRNCQMQIDSTNIVIIPHGIYAEITTEFWYRPVELSSSLDTLEFYSYFTLPATDFVNDSWLWVDDTLSHALILDINTASLIYENIVHRVRRDPSIFYRRNTSGQYEYRVFPNVGSKSRHAKISYWTRMNFNNGKAIVPFNSTLLNYSRIKTFPRNFKIYLNNNFSAIDFGSNPPTINSSSDVDGNFIEFKSTNQNVNENFSYKYDFTTPYFSKSMNYDDQEYYFTIFDSKQLFTNYINQKINILIDYDPNRTEVLAKEVIDQVKESILANLSEKDSINLMFGNKNIVNVFNRWVPCHKDTINKLLDSTIYHKAGIYSNLSQLIIDGINFNKKYSGKSSIILVTSSEYAPTPITANPIILDCLALMGDSIIKITTLDFSELHYSTYKINNNTYLGNQYFNEKIAELTKGEFFTTKNNGSSILSMFSNSLINLKGTVSEVGLYVEPKDGISFSKTSENINDLAANKKLVYEFGKLAGGMPIDIKLSALLDGKAVVKKYTLDQNNISINNESVKMWNWKYLRNLEDKINKSKKESQDLVDHSISNRILTVQTAFLCLEPWMLPKEASIAEKDGKGGGGTSDLQEDFSDLGVEVSYGPNPITNFANIKINLSDSYTKVQSIGIFNMLGTEIKQFNFDENSNSLNLEWNISNDGNDNVSSGVYYLIIKTNQGSKILKLVVV